MVVITLGAAFGVLSGRGAVIGMIATSVITTITALVGGSRYGVSSLTGPMTAAIAVIIGSNQQILNSLNSSISSVELLNLTLIFAALSLIFLTIIKIHRLVKWVPNLVISGFVNGIALLILLAQIRTMNTVEDIIFMVITLILAVSMAIFIRHKTHPFLNIIGSSFFVIVVMAAIANYFQLNLSYVDLQDSSGQLNLSLPPLEIIDFNTIKTILPLAMQLALIALLDTLLTAVIMDQKSHTKTHLTRELSGQSLALFAASLFGGLPGAQSTVPSMMLFKEGGHHKFSKALVAVFCIAFTFAFVSLIQFVPLAVFGGIILKIAIDVADFTSLKTILTTNDGHRIPHIIITVGTILSTVLLSLNLAVIGFTMVFVFWNNLLPKKWQIHDLKLHTESEGLIDEL